MLVGNDIAVAGRAREVGGNAGPAGWLHEVAGHLHRRGHRGTAGSGGTVAAGDGVHHCAGVCKQQDRTRQYTKPQYTKPPGKQASKNYQGHAPLLIDAPLLTIRQPARSSKTVKTSLNKVMAKAPSHATNSRCSSLFQQPLTDAGVEHLGRRGTDCAVGRRQRMSLGLGDNNLGGVLLHHRGNDIRLVGGVLHGLALRLAPCDTYSKAVKRRVPVSSQKYNFPCARSHAREMLFHYNISAPEPKSCGTHYFATCEPAHGRR